MKKALCAILTVGFFTFTLSLPTIAQDKDSVKLVRVQMGDHGQHPEIDAAITHLREAKSNLEKASHDYAGHRAKAIEHVNAALEECNRALESARH